MQPAPKLSQRHAVSRLKPWYILTAVLDDLSEESEVPIRIDRRHIGHDATPLSVIANPTAPLCSCISCVKPTVALSLLAADRPLTVSKNRANVQRLRGDELDDSAAPVTKSRRRHHAP
jgi:hypothetical protein